MWQPGSRSAQLGTGGAVVVPVCVPASACPAGQTGFYVYDASGAPLGVVCVSDQTGVDAGAPSPSPLQLAQAASARQPWPALRIGVNPGVGLTGLTSWFWLSGNPAMPDATASAGSLSVTVRAMLDGITWDFGDGGISLLANLVQSTALAAVIGVLELTQSAERQIARLTIQGDSHALEILGAVMLVYFLVCLPLTRVSAALERRLTV